MERLERLELAATLVSDVPEITRQEVAVGARHRSSLEDAFRPQKVTSKLLTDAFYATFSCQIKNFPWSDPALIRMTQSLSDPAVTGLFYDKLLFSAFLTRLSREGIWCDALTLVRFHLFASFVRTVTKAVFG